MFAAATQAATSFFARSAIFQNYNVGASSNSRPATPGNIGGSTPNLSQPFAPTITIGLWKVQSASHKVTNKRVSVWSFDKRSQELERLSVPARERVMEVLKGEASALSRLRHPSILEMVEPLEETRSELIFATEPILSSLELSVPGGRRHTPLVELDEVEIQKGILQICKGLSFMHSSAQLVHSNLNPTTIVINNSGDWKISGLGLTIPLLTNGNPTRWEFPTYDGRAPPEIQRSFDYMAPEYALDEKLMTASDMYSLGCVIYAVHCKGAAPFKNHGSLGGLRENAGKAIPGMGSLDTDLQALLRVLVTRHPDNRPSPTNLASYPFFSSLPISTLNFLERSNFTTKTREEKISFMKGLTTVLDKFSQGLRIRKILPSLVEEMKDTHLLPYILPNVFAISTALTPAQFGTTVLPSLKPLFSIKEPPQNMLTLLDNIGMLQEKTEKPTFREHVLPLVYNALESEHAQVQEKALKVIPDLCDTIDYAEVQGTLFPRVALVFAKTRILTVKVATLLTFLALVKTLDQSSLTQKLVPLLAKIRTKEPAVMMATLSVHEAMGFKVDREAVATLVLPQLWAMSMGPLLNVDQFGRFMSVIKKLGDRVEKEHNQFLRDTQRIEDRSATANGTIGPISTMGAVTFESLVAGGAPGAQPQAQQTTGGGEASWDDDVWGSIFSDDKTQSLSSPPAPKLTTPAIAPVSTFNRNASTSSTSPRSVNPSPLQPSSLSRSTVKPVPTISSPPLQPQAQPTANFTMSSPAIAPHQPAIQSRPTPNYNISLNPLPSVGFSAPINPTSPSIGVQPMTLPSFGPTPTQMPYAAQTTLMQPMKPATTSWNAPKKPTNNDWGDFDPLA